MKKVPVEKEKLTIEEVRTLARADLGPEDGRFCERDELFAERIPFCETRCYVKILPTNRAIQEGFTGVKFRNHNLAAGTTPLYYGEN